MNINEMLGAQAREIEGLKEEIRELEYAVDDAQLKAAAALWLIPDDVTIGELQDTHKKLRAKYNLKKPEISK